MSSNNNSDFLGPANTAVQQANQASTSIVRDQSRDRARRANKLPFRPKNQKGAEDGLVPIAKPSEMVTQSLVNASQSTASPVQNTAGGPLLNASSASRSTSQRPSVDANVAGGSHAPGMAKHAPSLAELEGNMLAKADASGLFDMEAKLQDCIRQRSELDQVFLCELQRLSQDARRFLQHRDTHLAVVAQLEVERKEKKAAVDKLAAVSAEKDKELSELRAQLEDAEHKLGKAEADCKSQASQVTEMKGELTQAREQADTQRQKADDLSTSLAQKDQQLAALNRMNETHAQQGESDLKAAESGYLATLNSWQQAYERLEAEKNSTQGYLMQQVNMLVADRRHLEMTLQQAGVPVPQLPSQSAPPLMPAPLSAMGPRPPMHPLDDSHHMHAGMMPPSQAFGKPAPPGFWSPMFNYNPGEQQRHSHPGEGGLPPPSGPSGAPPPGGPGALFGPGPGPHGPPPAAGAPPQHKGELRLLSDEQLKGLFSSYLPDNPSHAIVLGPAWEAAVEGALAPLSWSSAYGAMYGTMRDFLSSHPDVFGVRQDGAWYRHPAAAPRSFNIPPGGRGSGSTPPPMAGGPPHGPPHSALQNSRPPMLNVGGPGAQQGPGLPPAASQLPLPSLHPHAGPAVPPNSNSNAPHQQHPGTPAAAAPAPGVHAPHPHPHQEAPNPHVLSSADSVVAGPPSPVPSRVPFPWSHLAGHNAQGPPHPIAAPHKLAGGGANAGGDAPSVQPSVGPAPLMTKGMSGPGPAPVGQLASTGLPHEQHPHPHHSGLPGPGGMGGPGGLHGGLPKEVVVTPMAPAYVIGGHMGNMVLAGPGLQMGNGQPGRPPRHVIVVTPQGDPVALPRSRVIS